MACMVALAKPRASKAQGELIGRMHGLGMDERNLASVTALTSGSNEMEGERLSADAVRSALQVLGARNVPIGLSTSAGFLLGSPRLPPRVGKTLKGMVLRPQAGPRPRTRCRWAR